MTIAVTTTLHHFFLLKTAERDLLITEILRARRCTVEAVFVEILGPQVDVAKHDGVYRSLRNAIRALIRSGKLPPDCLLKATSPTERARQNRVIQTRIRVQKLERLIQDQEPSSLQEIMVKARNQRIYRTKEKSEVSLFQSDVAMLRAEGRMPSGKILTRADLAKRRRVKLLDLISKMDGQLSAAEIYRAFLSRSHDDSTLSQIRSDLQELRSAGKIPKIVRISPESEAEIFLLYLAGNKKTVREKKLCSDGTAKAIFRKHLRLLKNWFSGSLPAPVGTGREILARCNPGVAYFDELWPNERADFYQRHTAFFCLHFEGSPLSHLSWYCDSLDQWPSPDTPSAILRRLARGSRT